jgi:DNA-binding beta-propeller fold protein YncE
MDGGAGVYTQGAPYNSVSLDGLNGPYDVAVDTTNHRLFVADSSSHRILEYDLDSSNVLVNHSADRVIGQADFSSNGTATAINRLNLPTGLDYAPSLNYLFVADYTNNRVLVFDVAVLTNGENAINVLGQSLFTTAGAATSINGLYGPMGLDLESSTSRLFVSDFVNNRVLLFNVASISDGENAVNVLGQSNFTAGTANVTINGLSAPKGVVSNRNGKLFVADSYNHRVMIYDIAAITDGENAINVLGQSDFTTGTGAVTQSQLNNPHGLSFDTSTNRLFVSDYWAARVLVFDMAAITDGEDAVNVLGQSTYTSFTAATTRNGMYFPMGVDFDPGANRLFVADNFNTRVTMFDVSTTTITNGENAENVAGQTDGAGNVVYTTARGYDGAPLKGFEYPYDVAVDTVSHRLFVTDYYGNRVLVYDLDSSNTLVDRTFDHVLGQTDGGLIRLETIQSSIANPAGVVFDPPTNQLFVSAYGQNRVMVFDVASITDGENASYVLGQANFTASSAATSQAGLRNPMGLTLNANLLYVADALNARVMIFNVASISNGENAVNVLGEADFTSFAPAAAQNRTFYPYGVHHDRGTRLFVSDTGNNRVLVFDTASLSDGENAVNVLGQTTFTTNTPDVTQSSMNTPFSVASDTSTSRIFVSDFFNSRVLVFDVAVLTDGENAINVLGQSNFTANTPAVTQGGMVFPAGLKFEAGMNRLYISDMYNNRALVQSAGPVAPSTSTLTAVPGTVTGKVDLSWPSAGDDGAFNALTGYYRIQYATYTATWSTSTTPTDAVTSTITATGVTPGVVQSTTIAGLTSGATYYFALFTADDVPNWSGVSNTASAVGQSSVTVTEMGSQPGWIGRGETQRILGTAQVVADTTLGVTISSVAVRETGSYTADGNLTNVEVWVSSSGYIDANAVRLENTAKAFTSDAAVFTQNVTVSTTPICILLPGATWGDRPRKERLTSPCKSTPPG